MIKIAEVYKLKEAKKYINEAINDNWISFNGKFVNLCEEKLKNLFNVKHVLLTNNGTSATHCLIKSIKFKYPECKKIYIPNNCYIAAYNVALLEFNKDEIEIIPSDPDTWNMDLKYIDKMEKNAALLLIHNIGNIIPINKIQEIRPDLIIVEDNCEGFMGKYNNKFSGTDTLASSISFFANKHITCGEGGAFITNDTEIYNYIFKYTRQGITDIRYKHDIVATNYRINNIQAAILWSQFTFLDEVLLIKKELIKYYKEKMDFLSNDIEYQKIENGTEHSNWGFGIKIKKGYNSYKEIEQFFKNRNIEIRPLFYDYNVHNHLSSIKCIDEYKKIDNYVILLPLHPYLNRKDINKVVDAIKEYI